MNPTKTITVFLTTAILSGCATMFQGTDQTVNIMLQGTEDRLSECVLSSDEGTWFAEGRSDTVIIDRSYDDLSVRCQNETQQGSVNVKSQFQFEWLAADILWDLCIITLSCPIDALTEAYAEYPEHIIVPMIAKTKTVKEL